MNKSFSHKSMNQIFKSMTQPNHSESFINQIFKLLTQLDRTNLSEQIIHKS